MVYESSPLAYNFPIHGKSTLEINRKTKYIHTVTYYRGYRIEESEIGGECSTNEMRNAYEILVGKQRCKTIRKTMGGY